MTTPVSCVPEIVQLCMKSFVIVILDDPRAILVDTCRRTFAVSNPFGLQNRDYFNGQQFNMYQERAVHKEDADMSLEHRARRSILCGVIGFCSVRFDILPVYLRTNDNISNTLPCELRRFMNVRTSPDGFHHKASPGRGELLDHLYIRQVRITNGTHT